MASCSGQLRGGGGWGGHNLSHELQLLGVIVYVYVNVNVEETSSNYINIEETSRHYINIEENSNHYINIKTSKTYKLMR